MRKQTLKVRLAAACMLMVLGAGVGCQTTTTEQGGGATREGKLSNPYMPMGDVKWSAAGDGVVKDGVYATAAPANPKQKAVQYVLELQGVEAENFLVTGSLLLPPGGTVRVEFGDRVAGPAKPAAGAPAVDPATLPARPPEAFVFSRVVKGDQFTSGRNTVAATTPAEQLLPLKIFVQKETIEVMAGPVVEMRQRTNAPVKVSIWLSGPTKVSDLSVGGVDVGVAKPILELSQKVNTAIEGAEAPVGKLAAGQAPKGFIKNAGVTFYVPEAGAADISKSMSGVKTPTINNKHFYNRGATDLMGRTVVDVKGDQYSVLHLLAFSEGRAGHDPRTTVRVGYYGAMNGILENIVVDVPTIASGATNANVVSMIPVKLADGRTGNIYHLAVPMAKTGNVKEFGGYDLEFTRDMNTHVKPPDPNTFGQIPAGAPSDVVVLAASVEKSPVTMTYEMDELGNVFHDTQKQVFKMTLTNRSGKAQKARAYVESAGPGTGQELQVARKSWTVEKTVDLAPGESERVDLDVTPGKRGWFTAKVAVDVDGKTLQQRDTTYAVLAPDTRKATADESPFGIWEFWHPHSVRPKPNQVEILGTLMNKGGWRHTYGGSPKIHEGANADGEPAEPGELLKEFKKKYNIQFGLNNLPGAKNYQGGEGWWNEEEFNATVPKALAAIKNSNDYVVKVLHESRSSLTLVRRYSELLGGAPYIMPEAEDTKLKKQFENVKKYTSAIKKIDPEVKIVLINDYPVVATEYLKRGFPKENFDVIGLEGAMFSRSPERQPDWLTLLGNTHEMKRALKKYGYDKPIWTTEALYHATEAGALSLYEQETIAVREAMIALQLGIQRMAAAGLIKDPSDDYHWSNWGSGGYCYRDPEINPKPAYAAYAWLTQVLDRAKPAGNLKTPNTSLHVVDFVKPDGSHVYGVWTANGVQKVTLAKEGTPKVWDIYGNPLAVGNGPIAIDASTSPVYITDCTLSSVLTATPVEEVDSNTGKKLLDFDKPEQLVEVKERSKVVEGHWDTPRLKGDFTTAYVTEDGATALKVTLKPDQDERKLLPRYVEFKLAEPIKLEGRPYEFTLRVKGNAGWGRIMFEVVDAKGRVWTSTGNQYAGASNASDPHGQSMVSFLGWDTIRFPVVGMYPGADQETYWPKNYNWWASTGPELAGIPEKDAKNKADFDAAMVKYQEEMKAYDVQKAQYDEALKVWTEQNKNNPKATKGKPVPPKELIAPKLKREIYQGTVPVDYPLTLTKVIVDARPSILYINDEMPVANPTIFIDNLGVTQPPKGE
jgi:hypothetical protein